MGASHDLASEHRGVERMMRVLRAMAALPPTADDLPALREALEFLRVFVDGCHHFKEERLLFPALTRARVPGTAEAIATLLAEHEQGRAIVGRLTDALDRAEAGDGRALGEVSDLITAYAALLHDHIAAEDDELFPIADRELAAAVQDKLVAGYSAVEEDVIGQGRHEAFHATLEDLEARYL